MKRVIKVCALILVAFFAISTQFPAKSDYVSASPKKDFSHLKELIKEIPTTMEQPAQAGKIVIASHKTKSQVVTFTHDLTSDEIKQYEEKYQVKFAQKRSRTKPRYVVTPQNEQKFKELLNESAVEATYNNDTYKVAAQTADWGIDKINTRAAWEYTPSAKGDNVVIAVIDSGVQLDHPDLAGTILTGGYDYVNGDDDVSDDNGHGTHVAGILVAQDNTIGTVGVSPNAKILPFKVCAADGTCSALAIVDAIEDAVEANVDIINLSIGGSANTLIQAAVNSATTAGIMVVSAAGNEGQNGCLYPGAYENVVCVGSINNADVRGTFSNYGLGLDVVTPGVAIQSLGLGSTYTSLDGTSMSTAYYSGAAADLVSFIKELCVSEPSSQICSDIRGYTQLLLNVIAVRDIGTPGTDSDFGNGAIDLSPLFTDLTSSYTPASTVVAQGQSYPQQLTLTNANSYDISLASCTIESDNVYRAQTIPAYAITTLSQSGTTYTSPATAVKYTKFTFPTPISMTAGATITFSYNYLLSAETVASDTIYVSFSCVFDKTATGDVEQYRSEEITQTATADMPATLKNVYFTFGKLKYNKYASPSSLRSGDTAYIKNFNSSRLRLLQVFLYDYAKRGNQGYSKSKVTSTSMYLRTSYNLPTGKRYAYVMKFQDKATGIIATKYFVVYTTKTWLGRSTL